MISIQILDYKYGEFEGAQMISDSSFSSSADWNLGTGWAISGGSATHSGGAQGYLRQYNLIFLEFHHYRIKYKISGRTAGSLVLANHLAGGANGFSQSANGTFEYDWVQGATNNDNLSLWGSASFDGSLEYAMVYPLTSINFDESIVGSLDVGDSESFPLALTFGISDVRSLEARSGTYSKTFKIPATKNNNKIFKAAYYEESFIPNNNVSTTKPCRILVDENYSVTGKIQLMAIGKSISPTYYSCVFYGDNIDWASSLNNKLLKDLSVKDGVNGSGWDNLNNKGATSGIDLAINLNDISSTWEVVDAQDTQPSGGDVTTNTSPIVYPVISYGEMNEGGIAATIQCLKTCYEANGFGSTGYWGWDDSNPGNPYGTPQPVCDWRPCIFIYDIIKQIFFQEGYTIVSNFIDTTMFKKLIMALPNFKYNNVDERVSDNSWEGTFNTGVALEGGAIQEYSYVQAPSDQGEWIWPAINIIWDSESQLVENTDYTPAIYDNNTGVFTMQEYGLFDINLQNLGVWLESTCYGAATAEDVSMEYIQIRMYIATVGQSSWNIPTGGYFNLIGEPGGTPVRYVNCNYLGTTGYPKSFSPDNFIIENRYLNKGDRVLFKYVTKVKHHDVNGKTIGISSTLFGGGEPNGPAATGISGRNGVVSFIHKGEIAEYGQTYDLKNVIDSSSTQLGFLKGVSHCFNLQFLTDTVSKTVTIEPFNTFYENQNQALDWSDKVDFSQNQEDKWIENELSREVIFKYKADGDDKVVEHRGITYWDSILDEYPYREFLSNEFSVGKAIFENPFFAGTFNARDKENNLGWVPNAAWGAVLWGTCDTTPPSIPTGGSGCRPSKGYNFVPRILNWNRLQCASYAYTAQMLYAVIQTWISTRTVWSAAVTGATSQIYPQANSYDPFDSTVPLLTYGSHYVADRDCVTGSISGNAIQKGLYQTYYQKQIEMMKTTPRLKTIYLNLKLSDIQNLNLRRLVYIGGTYYRINQIIDFQPNNNSTTKVELVLWEEQGDFPAVTAPGF